MLQPDSFRLAIVTVFFLFVGCCSAQSILEKEEIRDHFRRQMPDEQSAMTPGKDFILPVTDQGVVSRKSPFLAVLYSSLLPGMGELYADRFEKGIYPLVVDGVLWLALLGVDRYGAWIRDDARNFAIQHAMLNPGTKNDQFFVDIEAYMSVQEFNSSKLVSRDIGSLYDETRTSSRYWNWDSNENRLAYRSMRIKSDEYFNAVGFVVLGLIANRVWSSIQSVFAVKGFNAKLDVSLKTDRSPALFHAPSYTRPQYKFLLTADF